MILLLAGLANLPMLLVYILILCIFLAVVYWLITSFVPDPIKRYAVAIVVVIAAIFLIYFLLNLVGSGGMDLGGKP